MPHLQNPKHEQFAQAIATGATGADAYASIYPRASRKTATEKASRWARTANISARVAEIRSALSDAQAKRDADVAAGVAAQLTVTLLTAQERRSLIATRVRRKSITDAALARLLHLDAQLAGELIDKAGLTANSEALPSAVPSMNIVLQSHWREPRTKGPEE